MLFSPWILLVDIYHHMPLQLETVSCFCLEMLNWFWETVYYQIVQCFSVLLLFLLKWQSCFNPSLYILHYCVSYADRFCLNYQDLFRLYVFVILYCSSASLLNLILIINQVHTKTCWQAVISESTSCHLVISLEKENQVHRHLSHFFPVDLIFPKSRQITMSIPPNLPFAKSSSFSQCYFFFSCPIVLLRELTKNRAVSKDA